MLLHSRPVHDKRQMAEAARAGADLVFLSPLFPTRSHPGSLVLGRTGFAALARLAPMPVIALGGVRAAHRHMLAGMGASGWGALDGLRSEARRVGKECVRTFSSRWSPSH